MDGPKQMWKGSNKKIMINSIFEVPLNLSAKFLGVWSPSLQEFGKLPEKESPKLCIPDPLCIEACELMALPMSDEDRAVVTLQ